MGAKDLYYFMHGLSNYMCFSWLCFAMALLAISQIGLAMYLTLAVILQKGRTEGLECFWRVTNHPLIGISRKTPLQGSQKGFYQAMLPASCRSSLSSDWFRNLVLIINLSSYSKPLHRPQRHFRPRPSSLPPASCQNPFVPAPWRVASLCHCQKS